MKVVHSGNIAYYEYTTDGLHLNMFSIPVVLESYLYRNVKKISLLNMMRGGGGLDGLSVLYTFPKTKSTVICLQTLPKEFTTLIYFKRAYIIKPKL